MFVKLWISYPPQIAPQNAVQVNNAVPEQNVMIYDVKFIEGVTNPRQFLDGLERRFEANLVNDNAR